MPEEYDYIVIGAGAGGSVLAYRLAQAGEGSVLVVEGGPADDDPLHREPKGSLLTVGDPRFTYRYVTQGDAPETWVRGRVAGGSTTVNGTMYNRGMPADYAALAKHTLDDRWNWDNVLAAYRAMEDHELRASPSRGSGGPLGVSADGPHDELTDRVFSAGQAMGWDHVADINESDDERIGYTPSTVRNGRRTTAASAFLEPALSTGRVRLLTGSKVARILFEGRAAVGVDVHGADGSRAYRARREVIVAGGAIESPLLLERSGIGPRAVLDRLGIPVVAESPRLGENLIEHRLVTAQVRFTRDLGVTARLKALLSRGLLGGRDEVRDTSGYDFTFHCKSDPSLDRPDLAGSIAPYAIDPSAGDIRSLADHAGMLIGVWPARPETSGTVHASGRGPEDPPVITPRFLETRADIAAASRCLRTIRRLLAAEPLAAVIDGEDFPTAAVPDDPDSGLAYARRFGSSANHAVGSCAMGPDDDDVVDSRLRVRGVDRLRVVDGSVLPFHLSSSPQGPVMAVGWIAGDLIAGS